MDLDVIAPMLVMIMLILTTGAVILLRPISKQLAELLHAITQEKLSPTRQKELAQIRDLLSHLDSRLALLEERQSFTEALLEPENGRAGLSSGRLSAAAEARLRQPEYELPQA